ncbi:MAG: hypothetical protein M3397_12690 [Actinomycetota bacterium]|nr:hypothetical protein [Rubrobacter sp.]MDQ3236468.1 hypothetical protein [Actinomycetota bacterium]MDQ3568922.1 hypothetical protein [Actinomycetota bacterium]
MNDLLDKVVRGTRTVLSRLELASGLLSARSPGLRGLQVARESVRSR